MKRFIGTLLCAILLIMIFPVCASAASGSFSGPSSARPGQTISVTFKVSGGSFYGYSGSLSYDSSIVTLQSVSGGGGSSWTFSRNGNNLVGYDNTGNNHPISTVFTATFKVNSGVSAGTDISISFNGTFSGSGSESGASATYKGTVSAPLSDDCSLSSLKVSNAKLSPAFDASVTSYSCGTVGFDVKKLNVSATARASGATVSISGSSLSVGSNTVRITVTAPNGAKKTYTIKVTREKDPDYAPSKNTNLTGIKLSSGQLSPAFHVGTKEYVVYVPFETTIISISGAAADPNAKRVENISDAQLKVGLNEFSIKCIAEDGSEGSYKVHVVRMREFDGKSSIIIPSDTEKESTTKETKPVSTTQAAEPSSAQSQPASQGVDPILLVVLGVACLILGFAIGLTVVGKKKMPEDTEDSTKGSLEDDTDSTDDDADSSEQVSDEDIDLDKYR